MSDDVLRIIYRKLAITDLLNLQRVSQSNDKLVLGLKKQDAYIKKQQQLKAQLLTKAIQAKCADRVRLLLTNIKPHRSGSSLTTMSIEERFRFFRHLGADANATHTHPSGERQTMLTMAIQAKFEEGMSLLLAYGADLDATHTYPNGQRRTMLEMCDDRRFAKGKEILKEKIEQQKRHRLLMLDY